MKLTILGSLMGLIGVGLIMNNHQIFGMLSLIGGAAIGLKGRNKIDKDKL